MEAIAVSVTAESLQGMPIHQIARVIRRDWKRVYFGAVPYLEALGQMDAVSDMYGCDDGSSIVNYFLSNAQTYRGATAKLVKAELKRRLKSR